MLNHLYRIRVFFYFSPPTSDWSIHLWLPSNDCCSEFCEVVSKIHIYTQEEVEKMTIEGISDDTQSCLEEAPAFMDASKSSSVGQPDFSPTVIRI